MEFTVTIPELNLDIIGQFRFYADRHTIIITDAKTKSHGTLFQVDATIDDTIGTELTDLTTSFDDNDAIHQQQQQKPENNNNKKLPPIAIEITPLLGSDRDSQWALLVARRLTTVVAEMLLSSQMSADERRQGIVSAPSPVRNFSVSVVMMIHVPAVLKKDENMKYAFDVVKKLEGHVRQTLSPQ